MADAAIRTDVTTTQRIASGDANRVAARRTLEPALVPIPRADHRNDATVPSAPQVRGPAASGVGAIDGEPAAVSAFGSFTGLEGLTSVSSAMVRSGSRGAEVKETQQLLAAAGFNPGPLDGIFGPKTRAAVVAFQRAHGLAADGIVGPKTMAALQAAQSGSGPSTPEPVRPEPEPPVTGGTGPSASARSQTLRSGSRGPAVVELQRLLASAGFNPGPADGIFGSKTRAAVQAFQRAYGLTADGIVGPKTWGAFGTTRPEQPKATGNAADFLRFALAQSGDRYVFGAETRLDDPNPTTFDCSELVQWACAQAGVSIPDGSWNQDATCKTISLEEAMRTPGALLFTKGHVAISLGNGMTIEARGSRWGVGSWPAAGRFTHGGLIPGMTY